MDPPYQRHGRLWSKSDKAYLIDSILNGFDIPKLYIADFTWGNSPLNRKKLPYAIIDGKQRLEAIFDFYDGKLPLNDDFIYLKNPSLKLGGLNYQDLKMKYANIAEEFDNFNLTIMSVQSQTEDLMNNLFVRLNRSMPLTGAEIRNAMNGPVTEMIRKISKHEFFISYIAFNKTRMTDRDTVAKVLMFEFHEKILETKKRNLDEFVAEINKSRGDNKFRLELSGRKVIEQLDLMTSIFLPKDNLLSSSGIIPVYYWLVRNIEEKHHLRLREFLQEIENKRRESLKQISLNIFNNKNDPDFFRFISYYRSPNDASSNEGRYKFLMNRFMSEVD